MVLECGTIRCRYTHSAGARQHWVIHLWLAPCKPVGVFRRLGWMGRYRGETLASGARKVIGFNGARDLVKRTFNKINSRHDRAGSWSEMVVVAVRDAGTGARAARLGLRVLVAAGFGFAAWVLSALLSAPAASASAAQPLDGLLQPPGHSPAQPKLFTGLTSALTGLVGTVDQVVKGVTTVTSSVVEPVTDTVVQTGLAPVGSLLPSGHLPSISSGIPTVLPPHQQSGVPAEPAFDAKQPPVAAPASPVRPVRPHAIVHRGVTAVPLTQVVTRHNGDTHARKTDPPPPPARNGDQTIGVAAAHDGGGAGKHPFIVLGSRFPGADLRPGGVIAGRDVPHLGRNAALPTTSPD